MLAGDILATDVLAAHHNYWNAFDVNDDRQITARDALGVINYLSRSGEGEAIDPNDVTMFYDVNADHRISASDALGVINAISRGEEVGELVELLLSARDLNDELIAPGQNGKVSVEVGQFFDLEVSYDDLRVNKPFQPPEALGVFQLFTDIAVSQPNVLVPVLNETQRLIIDSSIVTVGSTSVNFSIPEAPPGVVGGSLTYNSPIQAFGTNPIGEVRKALLAFGYTTSQFELTSLDFGSGGDIGFQIHWIGDQYGNVDLPDITVDVVESNPADTIPTQTIEFAPFLADGVTPNSEAVRFNINSFSRTFNDNEQFYSSQNRGAFDLVDGFAGVGGLGLVPTQGGGIPNLTDDGSFIEPFDAFSLRVYLKSAVTDLVVSVNPGEDAEATLLYGRDDAVPQDMVLIETTDTNMNGVAQVVISTMGSNADTLSIAATDATKPEGNSGTTDFTFTVTRTGDTNGVSSATYTVTGSGGSPADAADFGGALPTGTVEFAAGEASKLITISVSGDTDIENNEGFTVTLSDPNPASTSIGTATANGLIQNDDASLLSIAATDASKPEGDSGTTDFTFTVSRSGVTNIASSATYAVTGSGISPANATDFGGTLPSGTVEFAAGETSKLITISVSGDTDVEPNEGFAVTLSNPSAGATLVVSSATGLIQNDDTSLSIAATDANKDEGNSGTTDFTFTVTRSGDASGAASANYTVTGSGASPANATDFGGTLPSGTVEFAAGETSQLITISVSGDTDVESDEGFTVTLSDPNPGSTAIVTATADGLIQNDDASLSIAATDANKAEGNSGTTDFTFTVTRSGDTSGAASANYAVTGSGGDPANAADFGGSLPTGTVNFAAGVASQVITISVSGDTNVENDEGFTITLSNPSAGATLGTATATGLIQNDDASLSIAATDANKAEGNSGTTDFTFTVTRSGDTSGAASATFAVTGSGGDPADAADFGGTLPSGTVNFAAGETSQVITIGVSGDGDVEASEGFTVTLSNPSAGTTLGTATADGTIQNDDGDLLVAATDANKLEGNSGTTDFIFTVTRNGDTSGAATASYTVSGSGANPADAADFGGTLPSGSIDFAAGETSKVIAISVSGDTDVEANEGFAISLSSPTLGGATANGLIQNDDASLAIAATDANKAEGDSGTTNLTFTVTRNGDTSGAASATFAVTGSGGDPADAADFGGTLPSGTVNFAAGEASQAITISVSGDTIVEADEGFTVTLSSPSAGTTLGTATAVGTILNDDFSGVLSIQSTATVDEKAGTVVLTVTRTDGSAGTVMVDFETFDDTATAGEDYTAKSGTLTFLAGEITQTIEIAITDDVLGSEPQESFTVMLSDPTNGASLGNATAVVNIINVNEAPTVSGPVAVSASEEDASFAISESDLLVNASDRESDMLSVSNLTRVSGDASGVTVNANSLSVNPDAYGALTEGDSAVIVYSYSISDGINDPITQTVTITIDGFNDPPVAWDDLGNTTFSGTTINIDVLANDEAGDGEDQTLTVTLANSNDGTVVIKPDGTIDFTPNAEFLGEAVILYTITDEQGKTDSASVFVDVQDFRPSSISGSIFIDHVENLSQVIAGADPIRNGVKDADERGLGGAEVQLVSAANENSTGVAISRTTLTDLSGNYSFGDLAPGTYHVVYGVPLSVIFIGVNDLVRVVPESGDTAIGAVNFPVLGTQGSALHNVDILASSYLRTNATMSQISNGGREGGVVSFDDEGNQEFIITFSGYEDVQFAELAMSRNQDTALLTIIEEDGDVLSALLSSDHFVVSPDGRGVQFFGGINDLNFIDASQMLAIQNDFPTYRDAIDRVLAEL